jgi:hypothetical protein
MMQAVAILVSAVMTVSQSVASPGKEEANESLGPPAMECTFFVGEGQLLDGHCKVLTLSNGDILIKENTAPGFIFMIKPNRKHDQVLWNESDKTQNGLAKLGVAHASKNCWMSVPHSEIPFSLCLTPRRIHQDGE